MRMSPGVAFAKGCWPRASRGGKNPKAYRLQIKKDRESQALNPLMRGWLKEGEGGPSN